jgi:Predicted CDP-diglyceride synthetase/phosphatidate cytidylyltransferase
MSKFLPRFITAAIVIIVTVALFFLFNTLAFDISIGALALIGIFELIKVSVKGKKPLWGLLFFVLIIAGFLSILTFKYTGLPQPMPLQLVILVVCISWIPDGGAYVIGSLFGRHKMAPKTSPNKTWEGFGGGIFAGILVAIAFSLITGAPILRTTIICIGLTIAGVLGDLLFSKYKRVLSIKDFGNIFPGHGGVLDRFDSVLIVAIVLRIIYFIVEK